MTTIEGMIDALETASWWGGSTQNTPDGTYCPSCNAVRRMSIDLIGGVHFDGRSSKPIVLADGKPSTVVLTCVQCHERIVVVVYLGPTGRDLVALPSTYGGVTTPNSPATVGYYLDQAQRSHSAGALSAAVAMYRAALEQLLYEQGYQSGMLKAKIDALVNESNPPRWLADLDPDFLTVIKDLGNASIHPNGGDVAKQQVFDAHLVTQVRELFIELLDDIYEQPRRKNARLTALRAAAQAFDHTPSDAS